MTDDEWHAKRLAALAAPWGWLNLVSRDDLPQRGTVSVGAGAGHDIILPIGPDDLGRLTTDGSAPVVFTPPDGAPVTLISDDARHPPRLTIGPVLAEITTLNGVHALRVRDGAAPVIGNPPAIARFPYDPRWRLRAVWEDLPEPAEIGIDTSKAITTVVQVRRQAVFQHDGHRIALLATHGTPEAPQFVFRDLTARDETYPAARFVFGEDVTAEGLILDFNHAINPPCAFTEFAVCPLPPPQNRLDLRVEAGEKRPPTH